MKLLDVGVKAPNFKLQNQDAQWVKLSDFKGQKVLLYFYPKALTPGCTTQACSLTQAKKKFDSQSIIILGVSGDSVEKLKKFQLKEKLNFDLLGDETHEMLEAYGVWGLKKMMGRSYQGIFRVSYLIGEDGRILHVMPKVNTKTHHQDILDLLK